MCFRPSGVGGGPQPVKCSNCGKAVFPSDGILPSKCPFCREALSGEPAAMPAPGAPIAPGAPRPGMPSAPGAPGVPPRSAS